MVQTNLLLTRGHFQYIFSVLLSHLQFLHPFSTFKYIGPDFKLSATFMRTVLFSSLPCMLVIGSIFIFFFKNGAEIFYFVILNQEVSLLFPNDKLTLCDLVAFTPSPKPISSELLLSRLLKISALVTPVSSSQSSSYLAH